jgi:hypothetical protein
VTARTDPAHRPHSARTRRAGTVPPDGGMVSPPASANPPMECRCRAPDLTPTTRGRGQAPGTGTPKAQPHWPTRTPPKVNIKTKSKNKSKTIARYRYLCKAGHRTWLSCPRSARPLRIRRPSPGPAEGHRLSKPHRTRPSASASSGQPARNVTGQASPRSARPLAHPPGPDRHRAERDQRRSDQQWCPAGALPGRREDRAPQDRVPPRRPARPRSGHAGGRSGPGGRKVQRASPQATGGCFPWPASPVKSGCARRTTTTGKERGSWTRQAALDRPAPATDLGGGWLRRRRGGVSPCRQGWKVQAGRNAVRRTAIGG